MRGQVSEKLMDFLLQVNQAIAQAKADNIPFSPPIVRENFNNLSALVTHSPEVTLVENRLLKSNERDIPVRVYSPNPDEELPIVLYFHGGGHMGGNLDLYDPICRKISVAGHCIVISVDYRLAPEHPYPEGLNDCKYVLTHFDELLAGIAYNDNITIAGDSAGGAICSSLSMLTLEDKSLKIDKQVLIYPSVDYTMTSQSFSENGEGFLLEQSKVKWYFDNYFQNNEDRAKASPLHGNFTSALPQSLVLTAGCDPLRDEGLAYIGALTSAGVAVTHFQFDDMIHAFMNLEDLVPEECEELYKRVGQFIKS